MHPSSILLRRIARLLPLLLASFLVGCGNGSGGAFSTALNSSPGNNNAAGGTNTGNIAATDPLTNPDLILFASGRAQDQTWQYYAMNPDGSGVKAVSGLSGLNARLGEGLAVNQTGTFASLAFDYATGGGTERILVRLSDGKKLLDFIQTSGTLPTVFAANSSGAQVAVAGKPTPGDAYAIYLMAPDGTQKSLIYTPPAGSAITEILFAPNDQTLYFVLIPTGAANLTAQNAVLYQIAASGGAPVKLADISAPITSIHTSRDGTKLAFISLVGAPDFQSAVFTPYTLNADGTGLTKGAVTTLSGFVAYWNVVLAGRPDGFHVLYVSNADGAAEIYDMRPDGTGLTQITFNAAGNSIPGSRQASGSRILTLGGRAK